MGCAERAVKGARRHADSACMLRFARSPERWWQKPLAQVDGQPLPAELAVLGAELLPGERGAWINSRGTKTGAVDLVRTAHGKLSTRREKLPRFVADLLRSLYDSTGLRKGAPDLVIWNPEKSSVRFIEVKCPHWDRPSAEQLKFLSAARDRGIETTIVEWEFAA